MAVGIPWCLSPDLGIVTTESGTAAEGEEEVAARDAAMIFDGMRQLGCSDTLCEGESEWVETLVGLEVVC